MATPQRILDLTEEIEEYIESKGVEKRKSHRWATNLARKIDRELRPRAFGMAKVTINDTFKQNKKILIVIKNPNMRNPRGVLEEYLENTKGYPPSERWTVQEKSGGPVFNGVPYICSVKPKKKPKSKKKKPKTIDEQIGSLSEEEQRILLEKLKNR